MKFEVIARGTGFKGLRGNSDLFGVILSYLGAADLCQLSAVCRHLHEDSMNSYLWRVIITSDFTGTIETTESSKAAYIKHYNTIARRIERANIEKNQSMNDLRKEMLLDALEKFLDLSQMRIMIVFPLFSIFLTVLLLALHFDGKNISVWLCFFPILLFFVYLFVNIGIANVIYRNQFSQMSIMRGVWPQMSGPIRYIYTEFLCQKPSSAPISIGILCAVVVEVFMISVKLSMNHESLSNFNWGVVFIPAWLIFLTFVMSPFLFYYREIGFYYINMCLFLLPIFAFFVMLTIKLSAEESVSSENRHVGVTMALIFMPLWLIEGSLMFATLSFLVHGVYKYFIGLLEKLDEHISKSPNLL